MTSILVEDTAATLQMLGCVQTIDGNQVISVPLSVIEELIIKFPMNGLQVDTQHCTGVLYISQTQRRINGP